MIIRVKVKSKTIAFIIIDNIYRGILPNKILRFFSYFPNDESEISLEKWQLLEKELEKYAYEKLLNYLTYRERSEKESIYYLKEQMFSENIVQQAVSKAIIQNYINDERFAEILTNNLVEKGKSKEEIKNKLHCKGIKNEILVKCLGEFYSDNIQSTIIKKHIGKIARKYSLLTPYEQKEKILNYLTRKGFSLNDIYSELDNFDSNY